METLVLAVLALGCFISFLVVGKALDTLDSTPSSSPAAAEPDERKEA
jgi:hypothetical protein